MRTQTAGWIPATGNYNAGKANPIRHYFTGRISLCGRVSRPVGESPVATAGDDALNCANCQRELRKKP